MSAPRITGEINTQLNPFGPQWPTGDAAEVPTVGQQISQVLFSRAKPVVLDARLFPALAHMLGELKRYKRKLTAMAGDKDDEYELLLAEGDNAMIDEEGRIYLGSGFVAAHLRQPEVLIGAMAHEIGHRPKRWKSYKRKEKLTQEELDTICRYEETRADIFAGKALASIEVDCEPLCEFLERTGQTPHPQYFDGQTRAGLIRDAHAGRTFRNANTKKLFPEFHRNKSVKGHLGEY